MEKSWQLSVNVAFFMMGFVLFHFVFNSFLEVALRILETGKQKKREKKKENLENSCLWFVFYQRSLAL